tara:strand:+ start:13209 stop:13532 length:324 start_codon:yes stop_codon:yes gene_type:complete
MKTYFYTKSDLEILGIKNVVESQKPVTMINKIPMVAETQYFTNYNDIMKETWIKDMNSLPVAGILFICPIFHGDDMWLDEFTEVVKLRDDAERFGIRFFKELNGVKK